MTDTPINPLVINQLTEEQYAALPDATKNSKELFLTPDTTDEDIATAISTHNTSPSAHSSLLANKQDKIDSAHKLSSSLVDGLATVATSGSYNDLSNKPTIPTVDQTYNASSANAQSGVAVASAISSKQDTLVSGTNIKTINNESLLGSGNIDIQGGGGADQTYDPTSTNAQSGVAINGAGFLKNKAGRSDSLALGDSSTTGNNTECVALGYNARAQNNYSIAIGRSSRAGGQYSISIGYYSTNYLGATGTNSIAIGQGSQASATDTIALGRAGASATGAISIGAASTASAANAIQIGYGTNSTASTLQIGYDSTHIYQLLDSSGNVPAARLPIVTSVSSSSTDSQVPSAKLFYDTCGNITALINAL